jgi:hypothetical protein
MVSMTSDWSDTWVRLHVALGLVVTFGVKMEDTLRQCFWILNRSTHARVIAAGQDVRWLIEYCGDLAEANPRIQPASKAAIGEALTRCKAASEARNELIHGFYAWDVAGGHIKRSRKHKPPTHKDWTLNDIENVWQELSIATDVLDQAVGEAVGLPTARSAPREGELFRSWEPGRRWTLYVR